jgi:hypothetical protein
MFIDPDDQESTSSARHPAVDWLLWWSPTGPWVFYTIDPEKEGAAPLAQVCEDVDELTKLIKRHNGKRNIYYCPNTLKSTVVKAPTKGDVTHIITVFVDQDLPRGVAPSEAAFAVLLGRIRALEPAPTAIVFTGGGYQAYWRFLVPIARPYDADGKLLDNDDVCKQAEAVGQAIAHGLHADTVQNINRLMRLPGTVNIPNQKKLDRGRVRADAMVVELCDDRRWGFDCAVPKLPDGYTDEFFHDHHQNAGRENRGPRGLEDLPDKWRKLVLSGDASGYGKDRSRLVHAFNCTMIRLGWKDEEILPFLIDESYGISDHCRDPGNAPAEPFARRQIARAREKLAQDWDRTARGLIDKYSPKNIQLALTQLSMALRYNEFADHELVRVNGHEYEATDRVLEEIWLRIHETYGFAPDYNVLNRTVSAIARRAPFHPVREYFARVQQRWNGVQRIDDFLFTYAGVVKREDDPGYMRYVRAISRIFFVAAVRRIRQPGCKFDEMLVLYSKQQGPGKSEMLRLLAVNDDWFTDSIALGLDDKHIMELMAGKWIGEVGELKGRKSDIDKMKRGLSARRDRARMAYDRRPTERPRQFVMIGTTNLEHWAADTTGNRRYWPVEVGEIDPAAVERDRDQLWAEAAIAEAAGEPIRLDPELWTAAGAEQKEIAVENPYVRLLDIALSDFEGRIQNPTIWMILGLTVRDHKQQVYEAMSNAMKALDWAKMDKKIRARGSRPEHAYSKGKSEEVIWVLRDVNMYDRQQHNFVVVCGNTTRFVKDWLAYERVYPKDVEEDELMRELRGVESGEG